MSDDLKCSGTCTMCNVTLTGRAWLDHVTEHGRRAKDGEDTYVDTYERPKT